MGPPDPPSVLGRPGPVEFTLVPEKYTTSALRHVHVHLARQVQRVSWTCAWQAASMQRRSRAPKAQQPTVETATVFVARPRLKGRRDAVWSLRAFFARVFLPVGWPRSVTADYAGFQIWDSVQGLCSYVRGTISTAALLKAAGLGGGNEAAVSAALNFLARDMVGHLVGLAFSCQCGHLLDAQAKQWRFAADLLNNCGLLAHMLAPALPARWFVPCICLASAAHAVTGVAGGATRAALTMHFARARNAADLAAKESAQETGVTLLGMALGYIFLRAAATSVSAQWAVWVALTILHILANWRAMRCLHLTSLNGERLAILAAYYYQVGDGTLLRPAQVAAWESLLPLGKWGGVMVPRVRLGVPLAHAQRHARQAPRPGCAAVCGELCDSVLCVALSAKVFPRALTTEQTASLLVQVVRNSFLPLECQSVVPENSLIFDEFCADLVLSGWSSPLVFALDGLDEGHRFDEVAAP